MARLARRRPLDFWPGFVDALASLLMVMVFVILVFVIGQFVLADAVSGRDRGARPAQRRARRARQDAEPRTDGARTRRAQRSASCPSLTAAQRERGARQRVARRA